MKQTKRINKWIIVVLILLLAGIIVVVVGKLRAKNGIVVLPTEDIVCETPVFYLQNDTAWGDEHLGQSRFTMKSSGCLVSSMATALEVQKKSEDKNYVLTPEELNQLFSDNGVYNENGDIVWGKIGDALGGVTVYVAPQVSNKEITQYLLEGKYPLIKVRIGGKGAIHWLVVLGAEDGHYLCMDPLNGSKELKSLEEFGDTVYAMRCVYWE